MSAPNNYGAEWTEEMRRNVVALFDSGMEIDAIAAEMGRSRGSTLGKLYQANRVFFDTYTNQYYKRVYLGRA